MPISISQWRAENGLFHSISHKIIYRTSRKPINTNLEVILKFCLFCLYSFPSYRFYLVFISAISAIFTCLLLPGIFGIYLCFTYLPSLSNIHFVFTNFSNFASLFCDTFIYINISIHFMNNLLWYNVSSHKLHSKILRNCIMRYLYFFEICIFILTIKGFLIRCGDIEVNPGPIDLNKQLLTISHWNLNGIAANNFAKISLLEAYNAVHDFDIICISETFLDSSYSNDDVRLALNGYNLIRSDNINNTKRGGVCIYFKEHLPLTKRDIFL